jgi:hypothetical protein
MTGLRTVEALISRASRGGNGRTANGNGGHSNPSADGARAWEPLRREITRARRFGREFVLIRFELNGAVASVMTEVRALIRGIDETWVHDGGLYVLLPEADRAAGEAFLARVRREAPEELVTARAAIASFPTDGLTSGAILGSVRSRRARTRELAPGRMLTMGEAPVLHASGR